MKKLNDDDIKRNEKNGTYYFRKQIGGKRIFMSFKTKAEAEIALNKFLKDSNKKIANNISLVDEAMLVNNLFEEYISTKICKNSTKKVNICLYEKHFLSISKMKLADLKVSILQKWINSIEEYTTIKKRNYRKNEVIEDVQLKKSTTRWKCVTLMRCMLNYAVENNYMQLIPHSWYKNVKKPIRDESKMEAKTLSYNDTIKLISFLKNDFEKYKTSFSKIRKDGWTPERVAFLCELLLYTGVRYGEARALKVCDFKTGMYSGKFMNLVSITKQMDDEGNILPLKNSSVAEDGFRDIPLKPDVANIFYTFFKNNNYSDTQFILDFNKNGFTPRRNSFPRALKKYATIAKELGIISKNANLDLSNHSFRRTNTRYLYKILGLPLEVAAKIQGHTKEVMLKSYMMIDQEEKALDIFADF